MPAVIAADLNYDARKDVYFISAATFLGKFPNIKKGNYLIGNLEFAKIDKKMMKEISEPIKVKRGERSILFEFPANEVLKKHGIKPYSWICLTFDAYAAGDHQHAIQYPIYPDFFEILDIPDETLRGEIERRFKGPEEVFRLIRMTGVVEALEEAFHHLQKAHSKFDMEFFEDTKASGRKALEAILEITKQWKSVDGSKHLAEDMNSLAKALYSLSSTGGAHRGIATKDETEVILNSMLFLFKFINKKIKEKKFKTKGKE